MYNKNIKKLAQQKKGAAETRAYSAMGAAAMETYSHGEQRKKKQQPWGVGAAVGAAASRATAQEQQLPELQPWSSR
jgi:hypothetical protein